MRGRKRQTDRDREIITEWGKDREGVNKTSPHAFK